MRQYGRFQIVFIRLCLYGVMKLVPRFFSNNFTSRIRLNDRNISEVDRILIHTRPNVLLLDTNIINIHSVPVVNNNDHTFATLINNTFHIDTSNYSHTNQRYLKKEILLSENCSVTSDVRGNLGDAQVVTQESVHDWLKDRWQAAKNMRGEPIPGQHWLEIDLKRPCYIKRALIDWEDAFSNAWKIQGYATDVSTWVTISTSERLIVKGHSKHHIIHEVMCVRDGKWTEKSLVSHKIKAYAKVRLLILSPSTQWGSSVWRLQLWGLPAALS